ncbi:MAG: PCP reductase family protein, partial [Spirochaetota bacterium]|nr:PCP reductase family protein [Spirochaetota bacterium]
MQNRDFSRTDNPQKVRITDNSINFEISEASGNIVNKESPLISLPMKYIDWIDEGRKGMYDKILGKSESVQFFAQHLPVIVTHTDNDLFPFNCSNKGIGFMPKDEYLSEFIDLFQETIHNTHGKPWQLSIRDRIKSVSRFYFDHDKIDHRAVTSLEIFQKNTYNNLLSKPLSSLLFTGNAPEYISFQLNCVVEIIGQNDPRHTFIMLARTMFEYDHFHITQPQFPYAYIFWISEVKDKTPYRVPEQPDKVQYIKTKGDINWQPEASQAVNRAPGMIRQFIKEKIENYARERGFHEI